MLSRRILVLASLLVGASVRAQTLSNAADLLASGVAATSEAAADTSSGQASILDTAGPVPITTTSVSSETETVTDTSTRTATATATATATVRQATTLVTTERASTLTQTQTATVKQPTTVVTTTRANTLTQTQTVRQSTTVVANPTTVVAAPPPVAEPKTLTETIRQPTTVVANPPTIVAPPPPPVESTQRAGTTVVATVPYPSQTASTTGNGGSTPSSTDDGGSGTEAAESGNLSPTSSPESGTNDSGGGLSTGAKAGIGAGIALAALLLLLLAFLFRRYKKRHPSSSGLEANDSHIGGMSEIPVGYAGTAELAGRERPAKPYMRPIPVRAPMGMKPPAEPKYVSPVGSPGEEMGASELEAAMKDKGAPNVQMAELEAARARSPRSGYAMNF